MLGWRGKWVIRDRGKSLIGEWLGRISWGRVEIGRGWGGRIGKMLYWGGV